MLPEFVENGYNESFWKHYTPRCDITRPQNTIYLYFLAISTNVNFCVGSMFVVQHENTDYTKRY